VAHQEKQLAGAETTRIDISILDLATIGLVTACSRTTDMRPSCNNRKHLKSMRQEKKTMNEKIKSSKSEMSRQYFPSSRGIIVLVCRP
jgi:hypothetical protein